MATIFGRAFLAGRGILVNMPINPLTASYILIKFCILIRFLKLATKMTEKITNIRKHISLTLVRTTVRQSVGFQDSLLPRVVYIPIYSLPVLVRLNLHDPCMTGYCFIYVQHGPCTLQSVDLIT